MIEVTSGSGWVEVECSACGTRESAEEREEIAGFVIAGDGLAGIHCCWCGRDSVGLLEGVSDELQGGA
ncbi:hypothetical protein QO259_17030 [Salinicola sp. JS01]|uniref:hypothetical protein n=1 Tax=Salinicola sp. JS01 TaxID=3050071 RepID=UPI00255C03A5|nr:hypothetical protein [Salinicola sp. JS01]WIX32492.1 hypothetical protein QO259_17030 [Salinicola sp. JS01]